MPKAVLITSHFWNSKRKAGFHHLADALLGKGYEVLFLTGDVSLLRYIRKDYKNSLLQKKRYNEIIDEQERLKQFINFTTLHPVNYKNNLLNKASVPYYKKYSQSLERHAELNDFIKQSDLFIFESFNGLLWFEHFKKLNSNAKFVYRVSDDIRQLKKHFGLIEHEGKIASRFDLISVPSETIYKIFKDKKVKLHYHGIRKDLFDKQIKSPYENSDNFNLVFTGNSLLDTDFLKRASGKAKEKFHIIGPFREEKISDNVKFYGEMNFAETIPYIKFAGAGLQTAQWTKGGEASSDSLKVIQYTYCRLPVIAPEFMKSRRNNFIYYKPGDNESIRHAVSVAREFDRSKIDTGDINSWEEVAEKIIKE